MVLRLAFAMAALLLTFGVALANPAKHSMVSGEYTERCVGFGDLQYEKNGLIAQASRECLLQRGVSLLMYSMQAEARFLYQWRGVTPATHRAHVLLQNGRYTILVVAKDENGEWKLHKTIRNPSPEQLAVFIN